MPIEFVKNINLLNRVESGDIAHWKPLSTATFQQFSSHIGSDLTIQEQGRPQTRWPVVSKRMSDEIYSSLTFLTKPYESLNIKSKLLSLSQHFQLDLEQDRGVTAYFDYQRGEKASYEEIQTNLLFSSPINEELTFAELSYKDDLLHSQRTMFVRMGIGGKAAGYLVDQKYFRSQNNIDLTVVNKGDVLEYYIYSRETQNVNILKVTLEDLQAIGITMPEISFKEGGIALKHDNLELTLDPSKFRDSFVKDLTNDKFIIPITAKIDGQALSAELA